MNTTEIEPKPAHTPEPWKFVEPNKSAGWGLCIANPVTFVLRLVGRNQSLKRANANRIVACVNACAGIEPDAVPELLAAARLVRDWLIDYDVELHPNAEASIFQLDAAIKNAEGKDNA